ncbi:MAG: EamA family transporter [Thermodesulfobacteria bacterium]|nr:EamA family transporter [Thermodesulfobacteriota bacterium]
MEKKIFLLWLLTIFFWGVSPIIEKLGLRNVEPLTALFIRTAAAFIVIWIAVLLLGKFHLSSVSLKDIGILSLSGIVGGFLGMFTYFSLLKAKSASKVVPLTSTYPLVATILAIIILKEKLTISKVIGTLLVVIGIYFLFKS